MKANYYIHQLRDERALMLFSYLQILPENSAFSERLMACSLQAIIDLKHHHKLNWKALDSIIENGTQIEDPQEQMFTHLVGSPLGSFIVFPGPFQFYQYQLTRFLNLSRLLRIDNKQLNVVYFLLSLSQSIAQKTNAKRYSVGVPEQECVFIPDSTEIEAKLNCLCFSRGEMEELVNKYNLSYDDIENLTFKVKRKALRIEQAGKGYSDAITLTPFYKYSGGYILLSPSALLHSAYQKCKQVLIEECGLGNLTEGFSKTLFDETACLLRKVPEPFLGKIDLEGLSFLLYREDNENIFCVFPYLAEKQYDIKRCQLLIDSYVREYIQSTGISMFLIIYSQIEDDNLALYAPQNTLAFSIDDFSVILNQPDVNLNTLYYYLQDKQTVNAGPFTQEIDLFAYYIQRRQTFYLEEMPTLMMVEIGMARKMRERYYTESDIRYVESALFNRVIPVRHIQDIPGDIPAYAPLYAPSGIMFFMIELGNYRLTIKYDNTKCENYEIVHSIALWLYAIWKVKHISVLCQHIDVIFMEGAKDSIRQANEYVYFITLDIENIFKCCGQDIEEQILLHFVKLLQNQGALSENISEELIHEMFVESNGHFMVADANDNNPLLVHDGVTACHYLSGRWADKILDEIANFLDYKGEEKQLSVEESKAVMIEVIGYLENEAKQILSTGSTAKMLENCLALHHAMIYWSRLTNFRYDIISQAYHYIGSEFKNQAKYLNDYTEMNILSQGLIEYIIQSDFHSDEASFCINTFDRLFAIMHHIVNMGMYFDLLNNGQSDSEIVLLKNGRIVFPKMIENINIPYFTTLRKRTMEYREVLVRQHQLLPRYEVDRTEKKFKEAFKAEFGIDIEILFQIQGRSIDFANNNKEPIVVISKDLFEEKILAECLHAEQFRMFYEHFVLSKDAYAEMPEYEKFLQRYNRSVQLSSRPWVQYEDKVLYSVKSIYVSCQILLERIDAGTIKRNSNLMRNYIGNISEKKGHLFTQNLGKYFKSLEEEDIKVNMEVQICPGKPLCAEENLGDIDVLLIDSKRKKIVCIEAKDYYCARTIYDMISQNIKIEKALPKVIRRDEWCREHRDLFKFYSKDIDESYDVKTVFLTYEEPTYKYFKHSVEYPITMLSAFDIIKDYHIVFQ